MSVKRILLGVLLFACIASSQCNELSKKIEDWSFAEVVNSIIGNTLMLFLPEALVAFVFGQSVASLVSAFWEASKSFETSIAAFIEWLGNYWSKSYYQLARDASTHLETLDDIMKDLIRTRQNIERGCLNPADPAERSLCIEQEMKLATRMEEVRRERRDARQAFESYKDRHNYWYPQDQISEL